MLVDPAQEKKRHRRVLAVQNVKGGVGKTTVAVNLASLLVERYSKKVLLIDADPQCNASLYLLSDEQFLAATDNDSEATKEHGNLWDLFHKDVKYIDLVTGLRHGPRTSFRRYYRVVTRGTGGGSLSLVCGSARLSDIQEMGPELVVSRIRDWLRSASSGEAEVVIIDCPPSTGSLTLSALKAADDILVPMSPDAFALHGLPLLLQKLDQYRTPLRIKCRVAGVLFTLYPPPGTSARSAADAYAKRIEEACRDRRPSVPVLAARVSRDDAYPRSFEQRKPLPFSSDPTLKPLIDELDRVAKDMKLVGDAI
ncbi:hypothetical protein BE20_16500 [Sorangium cellulosum]|uniref:CobQ/CobB/MinD/ParA nucleotide binding domain-containing protein n=1 Tax=Sorangium cellulosum TaxID=56 RepID=A0A150SPH8_SORCE|nr:hypothetical protein BE20_16500 [Sorangium cellulosum]KYF94365.1 hypothetical protein BE18_37430 [Sorangium cellulosum]